MEQVILIFQQIQELFFSAIELDANAILLAKAIDGVYDSDPKINPAAKKYDTLPIQRGC